MEYDVLRERCCLRGLAVGRGIGLLLPRQTREAIKQHLGGYKKRTILDRRVDFD